MGVAYTKVWDRLLGKKNVKVLLLGLDAAGKTTLLYRLQLGKVVEAMPTVGFNVETAVYKNIRFTIWDCGGQEKVRPLWRDPAYGGPSFGNCSGMIFVLDSCDTDRIQTSKDELDKLLCMDDMKDVPILVFANKRDLPNTMTAAEISDKLSLDSLKHLYFIQECSATSGHGLHEGFDWLSRQVSLQRKT